LDILIDLVDFWLDNVQLGMWLSRRTFGSKRKVQKAGGNCTKETS